MASTFLGILSPFRPKLTRSGSSSSVMSGATGETSSQARLSNSSTPPTSAADSESIASTAAKLEAANDTETQHELDSDIEVDASTRSLSTSTGRSRRARASVIGTYTVKALSGTAVHAPRKFKNAEGREFDTLTRRRTISGDTLVSALGSVNASSETVVKEAKKLVHDGIEALDLEWSVKKLPKSRSQIGLATRESPRRNKTAGNGGGTSVRRATRSAGEPVENLTKKLSVLGKRGRDKFEASLVKAKRELRRLADTNEFAKVETKPVLAEVWSNGKLVTCDEPPKKKVKVEAPVKIEGEKKVLEKAKPKKKGPKIWLNKGLYAGQQARNLDWFAGYSKEEKKKMTNMPDFKPNKLLPPPMWHGQRLLHAGRNFKLPFDVCSPLPPGQPKPDEWRKVPKNRFVGDAAAAWKKSTVFDDFSSRCVCSKSNGCDESCQNRIMLYECDDGNCSAGREHCTNRAFTDLQVRRSKGGKYRIGVEVIKTADRGYGVRSNRCFDANQIIVEYTGEIITEDECDRRMNEVYKDNECYYLMLFDQNMIIDATRGSIARFVNHSCEPNCRMVKWIVAGKPRMALFAGDRPIMTGDELTYDYNFDPFSAKNVQECRCGADTCRGVLGPKPKDKPKATATLGESIKKVVRAGKRKMEEFLKGEKDAEKNPKKRKIAIPVKRSASTKAIDAARGFKRNLSNALASASKGRKSVGIENEPSTPKTARKSQIGSGRGKKQTYLSASRNSSLTLVNEGPSKAKAKGKGKAKEVKIESDGESSPAKAVKQVKGRKLSAKGKEFYKSKSTIRAIKRGAPVVVSNS